MIPSGGKGRKFQLLPRQVQVQEGRGGPRSPHATAGLGSLNVERGLVPGWEPVLEEGSHTEEGLSLVFLPVPFPGLRCPPGQRRPGPGPAL